MNAFENPAGDGRLCTVELEERSTTLANRILGEGGRDRVVARCSLRLGHSGPHEDRTQGTVWNDSEIGATSLCASEEGEESRGYSVTGRYATILLPEDASDSIIAHSQVLLRALDIYANRNERYKDNWRRFGWRGLLFRIRERAERAWDDLWDGNPEMREAISDDDLIDLINFAAFAVRAIDEGNRDGEGKWW